MGSFSMFHWGIVLLIVVLIFGTKKLRNIGQDLGGAIKGFKDGIKEGGNASATAETPPQIAAQQGATIEGEAREKTADSAGKSV